MPWGYDIPFGPGILLPWGYKIIFWPGFPLPLLTAYGVYSEVYKWDFASNQFLADYSQIQSHGAFSGKLFAVDGTLYAVIVNYYDDAAGYHAVKSQVWRIKEKRRYIGCFRDQQTRAMTGATVQSGSMTIDYCLDYCSGQGSPYSGVQLSSHCFCGTAYSTYGESADSECNVVCAGNPHEKCGAGWRNSVYHTAGSKGLIQSLDESNAGSTGIDIFTNDGDTYFVVVNHLSCVQNTIVYIWDESTDEFKIHQRIPLEHCPVSTTVFKVGGEVFMIVPTLRKLWSYTNVDADLFTTTSPIFKLEGSMFVKYGDMTSHSCYGITFFERDGEYFLGQSNQRNGIDGTKTDPSFNIYQWV
ncbi:uncharacterized protein [Antedon mediterranea]|uniref:uncharacterized protein n=1 Tax=Antedon mediterranea TaxID=105859 RepID=UPI003AF9AE7E